MGGTYWGTALIGALIGAVGGGSWPLSGPVVQAGGWLLLGMLLLLGMFVRAADFFLFVKSFARWVCDSFSG